LSCLSECLDHFYKYKKCYRCNEDCVRFEGTFVEELGYTLCTHRGDLNPPCIAKYQLELRFRNDYTNMFYKINNNKLSDLLQGCNEIKKLISDNGNKLTYGMLKNLHILQRDHVVRERKSDETAQIIGEKINHQSPILIIDNLKEKCYDELGIDFIGYNKQVLNINYLKYQ